MVKWRFPSLYINHSKWSKPVGSMHDEDFTVSDTHRFLIAIGSNRPAKGDLGPSKLVAKAVSALREAEFSIEYVAKTITTPPMGPARRRFANSAAVIASDMCPDDLLLQLKAIERTLGRRTGQRWGDRTIDLDIILWSGGSFRGVDPPLTIPHASFRSRGFVLQPAAEIAPDWRDPVTGLSLRQLAFRQKKRRPLTGR